MSLELINVIAGVLSEEKQVELLERAIKNYKLAQEGEEKKEAFRLVSSYAILVSMKDMQLSEGEGIEGMIKMNEHIEDAKEGVELMSRLKGKDV